MGVRFPKIPPNCLYFSKVCPGLFTLRVTLNQTHIDLDITKELDVDERLLVSAVARCSWLDLVELYSKTPFNDCKNFDSIAYWKSEAEDNAEAWRKWGRGEPWE